MAKKKFQLVVQLAGDYFSSLAAVVAFEELLTGHLPKTHDVDGYDIGSGTTNFFIYTDRPLTAYKIVLYKVSTRATQRRMRIAYRGVRGTKFTNLWPRRDPRPFDYFYEGADPFAPAAKRKIPKRSPRGTRAP